MKNTFLTLTTADMKTVGVHSIYAFLGGAIAWAGMHSDLFGPQYGPAVAVGSSILLKLGKRFFSASDPKPAS